MAKVLIVDDDEEILEQWNKFTNPPVSEVERAPEKEGETRAR